MKIRELITDKDWEMIYVGAKNGFFFIGSIDEFIIDSDNLSIEMLNAIETRVNELYNRWKGYEDGDKKIAAYQKYQNNLEKMKNFRLLKNREDKEYYPSIRNKSHMIIIVEGDETGRYATREEYLGIKQPEWKPNPSEALDDNYKALASEIVARASREYINVINFKPVTQQGEENQERRKVLLERWMKTKECGMLSPLAGQELIDTLKRNAGLMSNRFRAN